jgi:hypothetical protein
MRTFARRHLSLLAAPALCWSLHGPVHGQEVPGGSLDFQKSLLLPPQVLLEGGSRAGGESSSSGRSTPARLFRMPAGYLADPVGLDSDDDNLATLDDPALTSAGPPDRGGDNHLGAAFGTDNPFLDFRGPGDPGGVGYYRLHAQYQLFKDGSTSLCLGLRAFAPAGLESDGVANGPTVLSPHLAWYYEWESGAALHGFVGKDVAARPGWDDELGHRLRYGLAIQSPLPIGPTVPGQCLHLFIEALGTSGRLTETFQHRPAAWGVIPGLYYQLHDNWWMSSGVALPLSGTTRYDSGLLQITCSWRF